MKAVQIFILGTVTSMTLANCSHSQESTRQASDHAESAPSMEEASSDYISSSAARENPQDTTHRFIRTADLRFKVKNVVQSTYDIEDIVNRQGGFVSYTNLTSRIDRTSAVPMGKDSSLIITCYMVVNSLELRVPNLKLDTTLKEIARNVDFLNHRIIKAQDVALQILENDLTQKRMAKNEDRLTNAIDRRGRRLNETTFAEELLLNKQEQADKAKIANLSLADQINLSTITLSIYQRQSVRREIVANELDVLEPGLGDKLSDALAFGWDILESIVVFVVRLWALILLGIVVYLGYGKCGRKFGKRKRHETE